MRGYLFVFWTIVLLGILVLTAAYPQPGPRELLADSSRYYVYDIGGVRVCVSQCELDNLLHSNK